MSGFLVVLNAHLVLPVLLQLHFQSQLLLLPMDWEGPPHSPLPHSDCEMLNKGLVMSHCESGEGERMGNNV